MADYDLVITEGRVIDPANDRDHVADIAIAGGKIAAIGDGLASRSATRVLHAKGLIVTPGIIDLHVHAYHGVNAYGTDVDPICQRTAVTTAVDAGSSGPVNFAGFRDFVARPSTTRQLAFVAVAKHGVTRQPGDLVYPVFADPETAAKVVHENPDVAVGIKVRLAQDKVNTDGRDALDLALAAGNACERPIMVHIGETPMPLEEIASLLRPGDIITHCYTPLAPSVVDPEGRLRPELREAQARGVVFDVGHASGHFDFNIVRAAMDQGLAPDTISTDIHGLVNPEKVVLEMPLVMSKFLALGMGLRDVIAAATSAPARVIGWSDRLGAISVGREADLSILELVSGPISFRDTEGGELQGNELLRARFTVRAGRAIHCG